jgi:hypothetical protein
MLNKKIKKFCFWGWGGGGGGGGGGVKAENRN